MVLGVPLGTRAFVDAHLAAQIGEEKILLDRLCSLPELQRSWLILLLCAGPRANHLLRSLPPSYVERYAAAHDEAVFATLLELW